MVKKYDVVKFFVLFDMKLDLLFSKNESILFSYNESNSENKYSLNGNFLGLWLILECVYINLYIFLLFCFV